MNFQDHEIEEVTRRTNNRALLGCLFWLIIIISIPSYYVGKYIYITEFKEYPLLVSYSPDQTHKITVSEVGEPAFFGISSINIHYGNKVINTSIGNDGATLHKSNVDIRWESNQRAVVSLSGSESSSGDFVIQFPS